jgi:hypothetical protein
MNLYKDKNIMNNKITVKPDIAYLEDLLVDVANGSYKIPEFQREFIWKSNQMIQLFDSILKGYPIGSLLFWKAEGIFDTDNKIGPYIINKKTEDFKYILDGFQRISTLFGVLINPKNFEEKNSKKLSDFLIYFDFEENNFIKIKKNFSVELYRVYDNRELFAYLRDIDRAEISDSDKNIYIDRLRTLHDTLHKYRVPYVQIQGSDINSAVDIFERVNSAGTKISKDYILAALSYKTNTNFKLIESIDQFLNSLGQYNFENLKRNTVLNCISNAKGKIHFDVKNEEELLAEEDLEAFTNAAYIHITKAVDFLYRKLLVVDIRLLPYPSQLIFISEYFRLKPETTHEQLKSLENWFWVTTYSNYFTLYSLSQQRSAYKCFRDFINEENPSGIYKVNSDMNFNTAKYPDKLNFTGVRPKALQLFYLKSIVGNNDIEEKEGIKEFFIYSKKDRKPSNIVLRLSSEFEQNREKKQINNFIETSQYDVLEKHFITHEMVDLYKQNRIDEFLVKREDYLKLREREFVEKLDIRYTE